MRRKLVAGNWKMNGMAAQLTEVETIAAVAAEHSGVDVALCLPFTLIAAAAPIAGSVAIGAQDCHANDKGAHTGCIAAPMLVEAGATMVIVGHSERRADQGESDSDVRAKAEAAHRAGLAVILCVGETEAQRDAGEAETVVAAQLAESVPAAAAAGWLTIAYEPVWAIGTGRTPTVADVTAMHTAIRAKLRDLLGEQADAMRILYGGSMTADNAGDLLAVADVDGGLVGGASLTAAKFAGIITAAAEA